jgi:uncharacterized protein
MDMRNLARNVVQQTSLDSSSLGIEPDLRRYREIVRGKVRDDLQDYITSDEIIAQHGKDIVSVPIKEVSIPKYKFGSNEEGAGQGEGDPDQDADGDGSGQAGDKAGQHIKEESFHVEELADLLGEHLQLPRIKPRLTSGLEEAVPRYEGISKKGPPSLRDNKRTFKEALKRTIAENAYDPENPIVVPIQDDFRYRSPRLKPRPKTNAVIFYLIDVSGSMGDLEKSLARNTAFWTDAWIDRQYQGTEKCYIIHDAEARIVDRETFFTTRESGGTRISSAYQLAKEQMAARFSPDEWNIYMFHFSDGDNWGSDSSLAEEILRDDILPNINLFGYVEVGGHHQNGGFKNDIEYAFGEMESVVTTDMEDREDIIPAIKELLGTGR